MADDPFMEALNKCDFCKAKAYCVGFDRQHLYFECAATTARHQWSELREDPLCEQCDEHLSEHNLLVSQVDAQYEYVVCPASLEDNTFVRKE